MKKKKQLRHPLIESLIQFYECYTVPEQLKKTVYLSPYNHVKKPQTQDIIFTNLRLNVHVILLFVRQWQR